MSLYSRRQAIKTISMGALAIGLPPLLQANQAKKHFITLSFDDGFEKSSIATAEIFEKHKLSACINVIATGHHPDFKSPDDWQVTKKGDFVLWNELKARGHELMPHGYKHANKSQMPLNEAKELVNKCLDYFSKNLRGFKSEEAIFNMPYNSSTPELESWLSQQVLAFRTGGQGINAVPFKGQNKLTCSASGPGNVEEHLEGEIKKLLQQPNGWLIYNAHGLNGEGWGPLSSEFLDRLLGRLMSIDSVSVIPAGRALQMVQ
jgi:peptidoglycan/xylan/chitin deacetylase (PgdA/CDA1 family)